MVHLVHPAEIVARVQAVFASGRTTRDIAREFGLSEATVGHWRRGDRRSNLEHGSCPRCRSGTLPDSYAYLLGSYLGDGYITAHRRGVQSLSVYCSDDYPVVMSEVGAAVREVFGTGTCHVPRAGCTEVKSYSKHWTCVFPQHGPGRKHTRPIVLEPWQQEIVDKHTGPFLRGLFHSDGCRITNWTTRRVAGEVKRYTYPRYFFSNESADIMGLCQAALDRLGVAWRMPRPNTLSVARREAVAALDVHVGPKS